VGGVGHEPALGLEGGVEAAEHLVEGVGQLLELVLRPLEVDPLVQGAALQPPGGGRDGAERTQDPPGDQPAEPHRHQRHEGQGDARLGQELLEGGRLELAPDRLGLAPDGRDRLRGRGGGHKLVAAVGGPGPHEHQPGSVAERVGRPRPPALDPDPEGEGELGADQGVVHGQQPGPGEQEQPP
jgi:hypothetical protein